MPEPFGPMSACTSPARTVRSTPFRIGSPASGPDVEIVDLEEGRRRRAGHRASLENERPYSHYRRRGNPAGAAGRWRSGLFLLVGRLGVLALAVARALLEFVLRLPEAASQLRQLRPTEEQEDDEQDDDQFRSVRGSWTVLSEVSNSVRRRGRPWIIGVTDDRGDLPSRSGTGCGARRSGRCRRRRRRGTGGRCGAPSRSSDRTAM